MTDSRSQPPRRHALLVVSMVIGCDTYVESLLKSTWHQRITGNPTDVVTLIATSTDNQTMMRRPLVTEELVTFPASALYGFLVLTPLSEQRISRAQQGILDWKQFHHTSYMVGSVLSPFWNFGDNFIGSVVLKCAANVLA